MFLNTDNTYIFLISCYITTKHTLFCNININVCRHFLDDCVYDLGEELLSFVDNRAAFRMSLIT